MLAGGDTGTGTTSGREAASEDETTAEADTSDDGFGGSGAADVGGAPPEPVLPPGHVIEVQGPFDSLRHTASIGDFDGDGRAELVLNGQVPTPFPSPDARFWYHELDRAEESFELVAWQYTDTSPASLRPGHIDHDADLDAFVAGDGIATSVVPLSGVDGELTVGPAFPLPVDSRIPHGVLDLDGDGLSELVVLAPQSVTILEADGTGGFLTLRETPVAPCAVAMASVADVTEDEHPDLVVFATCDDAGVLRVHAGGPDTFADDIDAIDLPFAPWSGALADVDRDGRLDAYTASARERPDAPPAAYTVLLGASGGGFQPGGPIVELPDLPYAFPSIRTADVDGDDLPEAISGAAVLRLGDGAYQSEPIEGLSDVYTAGDLNEDGCDDLVGPGSDAPLVAWISACE